LSLFYYTGVSEVVLDRSTGILQDEIKVKNNLRSTRVVLERQHVQALNCWWILLMCVCVLTVSTVD